MRTDRIFLRPLALAALAALSLPLMAQDAASSATTVESTFQVDSTLIHALLVMAVVQVIFILSMASIMKTMSGPGAWAQWLTGKGRGAAVLLPFLLLLSQDVNAQAYVGDGGTISDHQLFWLLVIVNCFLFVIMLAQINVLRGLTRAITGTDTRTEEPVADKGPSWVDQLMKKLTRQVEIEEEKDILMHHEYDGIRELDNVLPPWWLWLFYFTIGWGVIYLINVHVVEVVPYQTEEYELEMEQAKADVAAFMATQKAAVDETNITVSTDASALAGGQAIFNQYCTPCHGADGAGSENSVGPNLTDAYWLHGGDVKDVFRTIKYGVPEKGMISWKTQLKPVEIANVTHYIMSLNGTGGATQKAPQGDLWNGGGATPVAPADTTTLLPDTATMALR
jgi:cytochrome c oxidase cbb3-type subunit 3